MGLPGLTDLALTVLLGWTFLLLMGLLARKELALTSLLGGTLLSQMGLLGRTELVLTTLNMDLLKKTGSRTGLQTRFTNRVCNHIHLIHHTFMVIELVFARRL